MNTGARRGRGLSTDIGGVGTKTIARIEHCVFQVDGRHSKHVVLEDFDTRIAEHMIHTAIPLGMRPAQFMGQLT